MLDLDGFEFIEEYCKLRNFEFFFFIIVFVYDKFEFVIKVIKEKVFVYIFKFYLIDDILLIIKLVMF